MPSPAASPFLMLGGAWLAGTCVAMLVLVLIDRAPGRLIRASGVLTLSSLLFLAGLAQAMQISHDRPRTVTIEPHAPACPPKATGCGVTHAQTGDGADGPASAEGR